jgi:tetratricopeptide (TPR) repeat protein
MPSHTLDTDRYELKRLLGRGGLGEVYLARDLTLKRDVAIKFVSADRVADPGARRALLHEARAAAALDHPNICTVFEAAETPDGRGFIVMQYVAGETVATALARGPLPVRDALMLCAELADALAAAHRRGIIHRDLKPGNIIITPSGRAKLLDFGIAKVIESPGRASNATTATESDVFGAFAGTLAYMSPEQLQHRPLDPRSDLFSLGLVLFECLTGQPPFSGTSSAEIAAGILQSALPAPSSLRPELTRGHDELCLRLMAKTPSERFQSAEEVIGAIRVLLGDTGHLAQSRSTQMGGGRPTRWLRVAAAVGAVIVLTGATAGAWRWFHPVLPAAPEVSDRWYRSGVDAMREGAYATARARLEKAVEIFPSHVRAFSRLAEAEAEMDDQVAAESHLRRVSTLVTDEGRLPSTERLRLSALRALVLRDVDGAIVLYKELAAGTEADAGSFVDLGRAQEAAGMRTDARMSYEQAIARDNQYAAAYLRLGRVESSELRQREALAAFAKAEELYKASADVEGQAEVALERGRALDGFSDLASARKDLERAIQLAVAARSPYHEVRAQLALSGVMASEGRFRESQELASVAIKRAEDEGLAVTAAGGLIDLAAALLFAGKEADAVVACQRAIDIADGRKARLTVARAKVQLAEIKRQRQNTSREAIALTDSVLPFLAQNRYRRLELQAQLVAARAHQSLDELEPARTLATRVLQAAQAVDDDGQWAAAAATLAGIASSLGDYPGALRLRERADEIHRRQGDNASLPYDLTNRADLLIRLNRREEAAALLGEVEQGIAAKREAFGGRARRVMFLRALDAVVSLNCANAAPLLAQLARDTAANDPTGLLTPALGVFCDARVDHATHASKTDAVMTAEQRYWRAAGALRRPNASVALKEASDGLASLGSLVNDELRWRLAAVGAAAARQDHNAARADELHRIAADSLQRVRELYGADALTYEQRPDLVEIRKKEFK